jgi:SAM-dependent methyltransferase
MQTSDPIPACLLCGHARTVPTEEFRGRELKALWAGLGRQFSEAAWGRITDNYAVVLHRCVSCGFSFFDPCLAGSEAFYRELEHADYFAPSRPEFARTLAFAQGRGLKRVLDVGCGSGSFLDLARAAGCETSGLELNAAAAKKARAKGHRVFDRLLHQLDPAETGGFDLITLFQVLEHVGDPAGLVQQAAGLIHPGGCVSIAVPSAEGVYRLAPSDPHQWPPHHMSRWRRADFRQLARATSLKLLESGGDILLGSAIEQLWRLQDQMAAALGQTPRLGGRWPGLVSSVYRKTGMKWLFPHWGNSIYAYLQKI